jgi:SpoVK/Ycf46/Vps4 family AAA+-type ATPase
MNEEAIRALRQAVSVSPDNIPLRQALAEMLLSLGRAEEAEKELRLAIAQADDNVALKSLLAAAFEQQGKSSASIVLLESLCKSNDAPAKARLLYARLLLRTGDEARAKYQYRQAVEADPSLADAVLAGQLGITSPESTDASGEVDAVGRVRMGADEVPLDARIEIERPKTSFKDVGGLEHLKEEVRMKIIHPLTHPDLYKAYGKTIGGGILLYGPPGCGKTFLARATAGEINAGFVAIGINDVLDMWLGNSEKNLHSLFENARRSKPCVLFFDEVDALAARRTDMRTSAGRHLINQFLAELDGVSASNEGLLILAATNAPWHVDPAFRRPGRFDRVLFVPPPDLPARSAIFRTMLQGKPVDGVDHDHLAKKTDGCSGADLKAVVDIAIEGKLRDAMKAGVPKPLTTKDLLAAAGAVKPSCREWFATARNYALYANEGGAYDEIARYLKLPGGA